MNFRKIDIKDINNKIYSWNPERIKNIQLKTNSININNTTIYKKDFDYPNWRAFINKLTSIFNIEEFIWEK